MIPMSETSNFTDTMMAIFDYQRNVNAALQAKNKKLKEEADKQNKTSENLKADLLKIQFENQLLKTMKNSAADLKVQTEISNPNSQSAEGNLDTKRKRRQTAEIENDVRGMMPTAAAASASSNPTNSMSTFKKYKMEKASTTDTPATDFTGALVETPVTTAAAASAVLAQSPTDKSPL